MRQRVSVGRVLMMALLLVACMVMIAPLSLTADKGAEPLKDEGERYVPSQPDARWISGAPLEIAVGSNCSVLVYHEDYGYAQVYAADSGIFFWLDGLVYGSNLEGTNSSSAAMDTLDLYAVSHVGPTGTGAPSDPWMITTIAQVGDTGLWVAQRISYVNGQSFFTLDWDLSNQSSRVMEGQLFHAADLYFAGSDYGYGYYDPASGAVGGYDQDRSWFMSFVPGAQSPADHYMEDYYHTIWDQIGDCSYWGYCTQGGGFWDTIRADDHIDNGAGLQWGWRLAPGQRRQISDYWTFGITRPDVDAPEFIRFRQSPEPIGALGCPEPTDVTVTVDVVDESEIASVTVRYRAPGQAWAREPMAHLSGSTYQARLGPFDPRGSADVLYEIEAADSYGNTTVSGRGTVRVNPCIVPVYPEDYDSPSWVMDGGTAYRYFRILQTDGRPADYARLHLSDGTSVTADEDGLAVYEGDADALGGLAGQNAATHTVRIIGYQHEATSVTLETQPAFDVEVTPYVYQNVWRYGMYQTVAGGLNTGVIAMASATTNGGLKLTLEESDPLRSDDDVVLMEESYSAASGIETGVGVKRSVGPVQFSAAATVKTEHRAFNATESRFDDPYTNMDQKKAQGIFLAMSILDAAPAAGPKPFRPVVVKLLSVVSDVYDFDRYIDSQESGMGLRITGSGDVTVRPMTGRPGRPKHKGVMTLGVTGEATPLSLESAITSRPDGFSLSGAYEKSYSFDAGFTTGLPYMSRAKLDYNLANGANRTELEIFFKEPFVYEKTELTLIGEGTSYLLQSPLDSTGAAHIKLGTDTGQRAPVSVDDVDVTEQSLSKRVADLIRLPDQLSYEVTTEDGRQSTLGLGFGIPSEVIGVPGAEISLGGGMDMEHLRVLTWERGVMCVDGVLRTETYPVENVISGRVGQPGRTWSEISLNALAGLWEIVKDQVNIVTDTIQRGVESIVSVVVWLEETIIGGSQLTVPPDAELGDISADADEPFEQDAIAVTALSWLPADMSSVDALVQPGALAATGDGFVVGGIYSYEPFTLTVSPAATLVMTYTDEAVLGIDERQLLGYRWDGATETWSSLPTELDVQQNKATCQITQLGVFALGCDVTAPVIQVTYPEDGATIHGERIGIAAAVYDMGAGIDAATVEMRLNGQVVDAHFIRQTGELTYLPPQEMLGDYYLAISASDVAGNTATETLTFAVTNREPSSVIHLPLYYSSQPTVMLAHDDGEPEYGLRVGRNEMTAVAFEVEDTQQLTKIAYFGWGEGSPVRCHVLNECWEAIYTCEVTFPSQEGWFEIDLGQEDVSIGGRFFVALEWLDSPSAYPGPSSTLAGGGDGPWLGVDGTPPISFGTSYLGYLGTAPPPPIIDREDYMIRAWVTE